MVTVDEAIRDGVINHIARYRLTMPRFLAKTSICSGASLKAAKALLDSLVEEGTLSAAPLRPELKKSELYYFFAPRTAAKLGHDLQWSRPLPREQRADYFAAASFCCESEIFRELMTKKEFSERFNSLWFPGQPVRYYLEPTDNKLVRLSYIKVDGGGEGHWTRLIDGCVKFLRKRTDVRLASPQHKKNVQNFHALLQRGLFQFTVLTALPEKKNSIEFELLARQAIGLPAPPMQVHVVTGLFELLFPPHAAACI